MSDDFVISVRQIGNYPAATSVRPSDLFLVQQGGLGGPYASVSAPIIFSTALTLGGSINLAPGASIAWNGASLSWSGGTFSFSEPLSVPSLISFGDVSATGTVWSNGHAVATQDDLAGFVTSFNFRSGDVQLETPDILRAGGAPISDANFGGFNTSPTPWDFRANSDQIATTAFVQLVIGQIICGGSVVTSFNGRGGDVILNTADVNAAYANYPIDGIIPAAPNPALGDASNRIATTLFVDESIQDLRDSLPPPVTVTPVSGVFQLANIAALRGNTASLGAVLLTGYLSPSVGSSPDPGGGIFIQHATDHSSADDGGTIIVDAAGNRWYRQFSGPLNTAWFGAIAGYNGAGGGLDAAPGFQLAINYCNANFLAELYTPAGKYFCGSALTITEPIQWRGGGSRFSFISDADGAGTALYFNHSGPYAFVMQAQFASTCAACKFSDMELYGYNQTILQHCFGCLPSGYYFTFGGFERCVFSNFTGSAIYMVNTGDGTTNSYFENLAVRDCSFYNMGAAFTGDDTPFGLYNTMAMWQNINVTANVNQTFPFHAFFDFKFARELLFTNLIYQAANSTPVIFRIGSDTSNLIHGVHVEVTGTLPVNAFEYVAATYGSLGEGGDHIISHLYGADTSGKIISFNTTSAAFQNLTVQLVSWPHNQLNFARLVDFGGLTVGNKLVIQVNGRSLTIQDKPPVFADLATVSSEPLATDGEMSWITNCSTTTFGATADGAGAHHVPVRYTTEGTARWIVG